MEKGRLMDQQHRSTYSVGSLVLLALILVGLVILSETLLKGYRLDLTRNQQYTLSEGTRNILGKMEEPVNLYLYFSSAASRDLPQIRRYAQWVGELLEEMTEHSGGKLSLHRVDPEPFSRDEDRAAQFGLQAVPLGSGGEVLYFGLAATNTLDDTQALPFLQPAKEQFLEYDVAKMISSLSQPSQKKLGLLAGLDMRAGYDPARQTMREAWTLYTQLDQAFDLVTVAPGADELPQGLDLLILVHPRALSEPLLYAIDQFVLGGGRLIVFLDPYSEAAQATSAQADPMLALSGNSSDLQPLLEAWGVQFDTGRVVGDALYALQVGMGAGSAPVRHLGIIAVRGDGLNGEDIVSADLEAVNFSSAGWFEPLEGAETTFVPLAQTSPNAAPIDAARLQFLSNPETLASGFQPTGDRYALAVRVSGPAASAFDAALAGSEDGVHLDRAAEPGIQVLLFADTDLLSDRFWVQKQNFLGQMLVSSFADNGSLVVNAVDHLLGSPDLISIRTRASTSMPFERVEQLRLAAESRFRDTEQRLAQELEDTELRLAEMQSARNEGDLTVLSEEQQAAVQRFMDQRLQIRSDLRDVRHDLEREIDALGTRLKLINIGLVPLLVVLAALLYGQVRRQRRRSGSV
jgi:ABC-type uncharacterized transport system involved in gliding motility auxiliary subunit